MASWHVILWKSKDNLILILFVVSHFVGMSFKRKVLVSSESHTEFCWCCSVAQSCPTLCNPMVCSTLPHSEFGVSLLVSARKILSMFTFRSLFYLSCFIFVASTPCFSSFCTCWLPPPLFIVIIRVFIGYNTVSSPYFYNTGLAKTFIQVFPMQDTLHTHTHTHTHTHEYLILIHHFSLSFSGVLAKPFCVAVSHYIENSLRLINSCI